MESGTRIGEPARRQHGRSFKASLVEQSSQPDASVAVIARNNGINANLLFKWRRAHGRKTTATSLSTAAAAAPTVLLPVHVEPVTRVGARSALEPTGRTHRQGVPEVGIEPSRHPDRSRIWAGVPDVRAAMGHTPRSSSMVENLNSRLQDAQAVADGATPCSLARIARLRAPRAGLTSAPKGCAARPFSTADPRGSLALVGVTRKQPLLNHAHDLASHGLEQPRSNRHF